MLVAPTLPQQHACHAMVDMLRVAIDATPMALATKHHHALFVPEGTTLQIKTNANNVHCLQIVSSVTVATLPDALSVI